MSNKIVIVEDEKAIRDMYLMKFKSSGYDVKAAQDGQEGLELIKEFTPELVLLDLKMPMMSGQEMLKMLRVKPWGNNILVIILTNLSQSEASIDLRYLKVEKYIVKAHTTPSQVVEEVKNSLKRHGIYSGT